MSEQTNIELASEIAHRTNVMERVWAHYDHAREKHPYFCDWLRPDAANEKDVRRVKAGLAAARTRIKAATQQNKVGWDDLLDCEVWEMIDALMKGDKAAGVDECYDAIAVLLRVIDVLEGRQKLGRPAEKPRDIIRDGKQDE